MGELKRAIPRSKRFVLQSLQRELGNLSISRLNRERLIAYGKGRAGAGAGPATIAIDFSFLHTVITHAAAIHGVAVSTEQVALARKALSRLGLIGKPEERDRRATQDELDHITAFVEGNPRQSIPAGRIVCFAVATAMRAVVVLMHRSSGSNRLRNSYRRQADTNFTRASSPCGHPKPLLAITGIALARGRRARSFASVVRKLKRRPSLRSRPASTRRNAPFERLPSPCAYEVLMCKRQSSLEVALLRRFSA